MASGRAANFGNAVIKLSLLSTDVEKGLKRLEVKLRKTGQAFSQVGRSMAGIGGAISAAFIAPIRAASDAQETISRFKAVFGEQTPAAEAFANELAKSVGRASTEIKNGLASFQAFFVGLGFGGEEARKLSQQLQAASIDFASFNNMSDAEAQQRFISALSGSSEVLDMYGINIKVAALEQAALAKGITKSFTAMSEQEKSLLRLDIILGSMSDQGALGDAVRTSDSFANRMKRLKGELQTAAETIGQAVLPAMAEFLGKVTSIVEALGKWLALSPSMIKMVGGLGAAFVVAGGAIWGVGAALTAISAHPIIAALTLIAGGALAVKGAFDDSAKSIAGFKDQLNDLDGMARVDAAIEKKKAEIAKLESMVPSLPINARLGHMREDLAFLEGLRNAGTPGPTTAPPPMLTPAPATGVFRGNAFGAVPNVGVPEHTQAEKDKIEESNAAFEKRGELERDRAEEMQRIDDEIARARLASMEEGIVKERALLRLEHDIRLRELQAAAKLTPEMIAKLDRLLDAQMAVAGQDRMQDSVANKARESMAMFDTRNIAQLTGARDDELQQLRQIAKNTRPRAGGQLGLPAGPA